VRSIVAKCYDADVIQHLGKNSVCEGSVRP
jgi:hypothetical protein